MDLTNQQRIKELAESRGAENLVVVLGYCNAESAEIYAETVILGDPTFAGPLAGVSLKLPVYHIFEEEIRELIPSDKWQEQLGMAEMMFNPAELAAAVKGMRESNGIQ